jgi:hypothetical protein
VVAVSFWKAPYLLKSWTRMSLICTLSFICIFGCNFQYNMSGDPHFLILESLLTLLQTSFAALLWSPMVNYWQMRIALNMTPRCLTNSSCLWISKFYFAAESRIHIFSIYLFLNKHLLLNILLSKINQNFISF